MVNQNRRHHRFLLAIYPAQSHINPALQLAKRLISMGAHVTLLITLHVYRRMANKPSIPGLSLLTFSDGYDAGFSVFSGGDDDYRLYSSELKQRGSDFIAHLIASRAMEGEPFTCLIYTLLVPWAHEVARAFQLPTALLWIQAATVMSIVHPYFHGCETYITDKIKSKDEPFTIPGLPLLLSSCDVPTFLLVSTTNPLSFIFPLSEEQFRVLHKETNPTVLVNTFEALEPEALGALDGINMIPIGPLIPSAFLDGSDPRDTSFGGDILHASNDYVKWLDSQEESSVVYVSFGSYHELPKKQTEEIARALLGCEHPFLWVVRENLIKVEGRKEEEDLSYMEELKMKGKIVKWCSQVQVLSHASLGCFVTHCGWNSTMETLISGVPVVAFPQWSDQNTNAKLMEDVWKIGVRVNPNVINEEGIVEAEEIRRCLDIVMGSGEKAKEVRKNAERWKMLSREAAKEGGPSDTNLRDFVNGVGQFMHVDG
ncbi:phloretin 4'-O-glucosyltransferase [Arachis duranensis]|uniref:Glycosyltransferase n=1 Tax=Arachis duranensis TaxID=130453 RepID=A0A6P4CWN8_ARADU|nr:phloretin 4'-O-glucosyltransferase [Arachis duranensis]